MHNFTTQRSANCGLHNSVCPNMSHSMLTSVRPSDVPKYLTNGDFYESLDLSSNDAFQVPTEVIKPDLQLHNEADFDYALQSIHFWGVRQIPYEVLDFFLGNPTCHLSAAHESAFPTLQTIVDIRKRKPDSCTELELMNAAIAEDNLYIVDYLVKRNNGLCESDDPLYRAAQTDSISVFKYFHNARYPITRETKRRAFDTGSLKCLQYLSCCHLLEEFKGKEVFYYTDMWPALDEEDITVCDLPTLQFAVKLGNVLSLRFPNFLASAGELEMLQYVHHCGLSFDVSTARSAAARGHLSCLQYIHQQHANVMQDIVAFAAAGAESLECLQYSCENGSPVNAETMVRAALGRNLHCIKYLHCLNCQWDDQATEYAAELGALDCLQYLHEQGCPTTIKAYASAKRYRRQDCINYLSIHGICD